MANEVAPVRKLIAAVLGTVATFVILFGAGMTSWAIVAVGGALLVLAIGLVALSAVRTGSRAWVTGFAHVHQISEPPAAYAFGRAELQIVIDAPGLPARSVKVIDPRVPVAKWPTVGQMLPIRVAIDDQRHVRILWDEVPTHGEAARDDLPPDFDDPGVLDDDLLIQREPPPWLRREPDDDFPGPGESDTADLTNELRGLRDEPVVVRQGPGGTIVLEGTLVEPPLTTQLPRRPRPGPRTAAHDTDQPADAGEVVGSAAAGPAPTDAPPGPADPSATAPAVPRPAPPADDFDLDLPIDEPAPNPRDTATGTPGGPHRPTGEAWTTGTASGPAAEDPAPALDDPVPGPAEPALDDPGPVAAPVVADGPISGVGVTLLVTDLGRSVAFYRDKLGFREIDSGEGNAVLASRGTRLVLRAIPEVAPVNRRLVHLNLDVGDVHATYEDLRARGVRFTYAPRTVNRGRRTELLAAAFKDPDGHGIALTQWRERGAAVPEPQS